MLGNTRAAILSGGPAPVVFQDFLTNSVTPSWLDVSGITGNRMLYDSTGKLTYAPANMLLSSATLSTQTVTVSVGVSYIVSFQGTGSITLSGAASATINGTGASDRVYQKVTATTTSLVCTVSGTVTSAQVEPVTYQTTPSTYVSTTAAAYYGPRFDYDSNTLAARGLLVEESRANLSYSLASYSAQGGTFATTSAAAPDGTNNSYLFTEDTAAAAVHRMVWNTAIGAGTYTLSIYAKKGTRDFVALTASDLANYASAVFDLNNGVVGETKFATWAVVSSSIQAVGNGWYRCSLTFTSTTLCTYLLPGLASAATGNTWGVQGTPQYTGASLTAYFYGIQIESGAFATSYIPTTTASVTRVADVIKLSGAALTAIGGTVGSVIEELTLEGNKAADQYGIYGNTVAPVFFDSSLVVKATNGTNVLSSAQTAVVGTAGRAGLAWDASGRAISYSGSAAVTDANAFGTIGSTVYIGSNNGSNAANSWVRALSLYNTKLSNALLAGKTTVGAPL